VPERVFRTQAEGRARLSRGSPRQLEQQAPRSRPTQGVGDGAVELGEDSGPSKAVAGPTPEDQSEQKEASHCQRGPGWAGCISLHSRSRLASSITRHCALSTITAGPRRLISCVADPRPSKQDRHLGGWMMLSESGPVDAEVGGTAGLNSGSATPAPSLEPDTITGLPSSKPVETWYEPSAKHARAIGQGGKRDRNTPENTINERGSREPRHDRQPVHGHWCRVSI